MGLKIEFQRVEEDEDTGQEEIVKKWKFEWTKNTTKVVLLAVSGLVIGQLLFTAVKNLLF